MTQDSAVGRWTRSPDRSDTAAPVIVVGLDGSASSWDAFCWATGEAMRIKCNVVAVHVMPYTEPAAALGVPYDYAGVEQARQEFADELKAEAAHRAEELGVAVRFITERGDPTHTLTDVARALQANLVVVGRSAKVRHHLAGSLSHRLTSRNDAPVVVVAP